MDNFKKIKKIYVSFQYDTTIQEQVVNVEPYERVEVYEQASDFYDDKNIKLKVVLGAYAQVTYVFLKKLEYKESLERHVTFILNGRGAAVTLQGAYIVKGKAQHTITIYQIHNFPQTVSSSLLKMVAQEDASITYKAHVYIDLLAHKVQALQSLKALVMDKAVVFAQPELEIFHNNVACTHAVAVGQLNKEHIFYGASRGISEDIFKKMLINGFLL